MSELPLDLLEAIAFQNDAAKNPCVQAEQARVEAILDHLEVKLKSEGISKLYEKDLELMPQHILDLNNFYANATTTTTKIFPKTPAFWHQIAEEVDFGSMKLRKELFGHSNWYSLHKSVKKEIIKKMVNSNEFQNFRVGSKRL